MAPSGGHTFIPKAVKAFQFAVSKTTALLRARLAQSSTNATTNTVLEAIPARVAKGQPKHPLALLRQSRSGALGRGRFFSTATRALRETFPDAAQALRSTPASKTVGAAARSFPQSATRTALASTTHAPFSSALRPKLLGGALPRSAGGYTLGGSGTRAFSSVPASQAQVVQNVSAAVRAFCLQGFRSQYDGTDPKTGSPKFTAVSKQQENISRKVGTTLGKATKGTSLLFNLAPTVTAFCAAPASAAMTLESSTLLPSIKNDFASARRTLLQIEADLSQLAQLGSLPIVMPSETVIEMRFPGCDGESVGRLCEELGVLRGVVREDPGWDTTEGAERDVEMALLFPWAPDENGSTCSEDFDDSASLFFEPHIKATNGSRLEWQSMLTAPAHSQADEQSSLGISNVDHISIPTGRSPYSDLFPDENEHDTLSFHHLSDASDIEDHGPYAYQERQVWSDMHFPDSQLDTQGYEGVEGIWRFLREIDDAGTSIQRSGPTTRP